MSVELAVQWMAKLDRLWNACDLNDQEYVFLVKLIMEKVDLSESASDHSIR